MSRRLWIIWLMLALLPLRGWAVATMQMPGGVGEAAAAQAPPAAAPAHGSAPCHGAEQPGFDAAGHGCSLCDLCHSAVNVPPEAGKSAAALPEVAPLPAVALDTGRCLVGGLDRPPRTFLA